MQLTFASIKKSSWLTTVILVMLIVYNGCKKSDQQNLRVTSITPNSGPAGNLVTINGTGFNTDPTLDSVIFNGVPALISHATASQLQVLVPAGATTGNITVYVSGQGATGPVYTLSSVGISAVSPGLGIAGDTVTITGLGLSNTGSLDSLAGPPIVKFNGKASAVVSATPTQVMALVPGKAGVGPVTVTIGGETATGPVFNYLGFDTLYPATGGVGTLITIKGAFGPAPAQDTVTVNGVKAVIDSATATKLVITVPAGAATGAVVIRTGGKIIAGSAFTFVAPPTAASIFPGSGPAGTHVAITGTGFSAVLSQNAVAFNGIAAVVDSVSPTRIVATVPAGMATGPVRVSVNNQSVNGPVFTVQGLTIAALVPNYVIGPTTDTIKGSGFSTTAAQNIVKYNGTAVTVISATDTELVVNLPAGITSGTVTLQVGGSSVTGPVYTTICVTTLAGGGAPGLADGQGADAQFTNPSGVAVDLSGNVYVADAGANNIRKITPAGLVTNFAGDPGGSPGYTDASGASAQFNNPLDIAIDKNKNLYVVDQGNLVVRKIAPNGTVTTFATLSSGDAPGGVAVDPTGNVYVTDNGNYTSGQGYVYEYSPTGSQINSFYNPNAQELNGIAVDGAGNIYTVDYNGNIYLGSNLISSFGGLVRITIAPNGSIIVAADPYAWNQIVQLNPTASYYTQTVLFGGAGLRGTYGYQDGPLATSLLSGMAGVTVDASGNIYFTDEYAAPPGYNYTNVGIRKASLH